MTNVHVLRRMKLVEDITAAVLMVDKYGGKDTHAQYGGKHREGELCARTLQLRERVWAGVCAVYRHIARCVFTIIFIN